MKTFFIQLFKTTINQQTIITMNVALALTNLAHTSSPDRVRCFIQTLIREHPETHSLLFPTCLQLRNLPDNISTIELGEYFQSFGTLTSISNNSVTRTGTIAFTTPESANQAVSEMNGRVIDGHFIQVSFHVFDPISYHPEVQSPIEVVTRHQEPEIEVPDDVIGNNTLFNYREWNDLSAGERKRRLIALGLDERERTNFYSRMWRACNPEKSRVHRERAKEKRRTQRIQQNRAENTARRLAHELARRDAQANSNMIARIF